MNRLKQKYLEHAVPKLTEAFGLTNSMMVPRITKIVVNVGIGPIKDNKDAVESLVTDLSLITGQKPSPRQAKKSEAGFKIKGGEVVGYTVTLRGERMWAFLDKLVSVALPRVRDFRGLKTTAFDNAGNYSIGIREHVIFPEVNPNTTKGIRSLQVNIVTENVDQLKCKAMLSELGIPFKEKEQGR